MPYRFKCRNCDEDLYIETVIEKNTEHNCSNCGVFNVVSKEGHWMDGKWHEMEILENDGNTVEVGKQTTNISTSVRIALSEKYEVLNTYQLLLFILMIVSTGFTFYSLSELNKVSNQYGGIAVMNSAMIGTLITYTIGIFSLYCLTKIIDFLFDLDKKN
jgi:hypothetical protein